MRSTSKRSRRSGNTSKLDRFEQDMKTRKRIMRSMRIRRSKSKRSRRSWNTKKLHLFDQAMKRIMG